ncbi:MAG: hypothetical protein GF417_10370 [Candidatus Latescibacteria bacterium]|nr:hypothetical protein [bacterium]MBD3424832.1 hypothetical protein [Candidatus Latescibacterota bacterium]
MDWKILRKIDIEIDPEEVRRIVGLRKDSGGPSSQRGAERIDSALELAGELIEPAAIYTITEGRNIAGPPVFALLEEMALCVCTVGSGLEERAAELSREGALLEALVVDTAGSVAVERTADHVNGIISDIARRKGKRGSLRASPGYGNWDISAQKQIFSIAPAERIGVTLGGGMMMKPEKSISFAVHISENPVRLRSANDCASCDRGDCPYRKRL